MQQHARLSGVLAFFWFQYPQADRRGCNRRPRPPTHNSGRVSVSTSGSKGVQQDTVFLLEVSEVGFSIHKRIEGGATADLAGYPPPGLVFQYPQADRRGCNSCRTALGFTSKCSFSIHKRIEGGATFVPYHKEPESFLFQYPQADRRGCNRRRSGRPLRPQPLFQYPQADRRGCNTDDPIAPQNL